MVVFLDRTITLSSTAFEYNFGVNTQFYANLINAIPGQGFGPAVKMRVYAKGRGYEDVEIPYGTPIVQLHGYGNKVTFSGSGAQIQITLSSTPIPLSATDIGQAQLYAKGTIIPDYTYQSIGVNSSTTPVTLAKGTTVLVVMDFENTTGLAISAPTVSDSAGNKFTPGFAAQTNNGSSQAAAVYMTAVYNAPAASDYTVTIGSGGNIGSGTITVFFITNVPSKAIVDFDNAVAGNGGTSDALTLSGGFGLSNELIIAVVAGSYTSIDYGGYFPASIGGGVSVVIQPAPMSFTTTINTGGNYVAFGLISIVGGSG